MQVGREWLSLAVLLVLELRVYPQTNHLLELQLELPQIILQQAQLPVHFQRIH